MKIANGDGGEITFRNDFELFFISYHGVLTVLLSFVGNSRNFRNSKKIGSVKNFKNSRNLRNISSMKNLKNISDLRNLINLRI